jgi:hypothetical protein
VSSSARDAFLGTGDSSGTGATFADRLACRGFDLVKIARNEDQLETNASRPRSEAGIAVAVVRDHPTVTKDLARLETRQRRDGGVGLFADNAGALVPGGFADSGKSALPRVFANVRKQPMPWRIQ